MVYERGDGWNEKGVNIVALRNDSVASGKNTNDDVFVKTAVKNIANKRDQNIVTTKLFTNEDEAIAWLKSV